MVPTKRPLPIIRFEIYGIERWPCGLSFAHRARTRTGPHTETWPAMHIILGGLWLAISGVVIWVTKVPKLSNHGWGTFTYACLCK